MDSEVQSVIKNARNAVHLILVGAIDQIAQEFPEKDGPDFEKAVDALLVEIKGHIGMFEND